MNITSDSRSKSGGSFARLIRMNAGSKELEIFLANRQETFFDLFMEFLEVYYPEFLEIEDIYKPPTALTTRFSEYIFTKYGVSQCSKVIKDNLIDFVDNKISEWLNK